MYQRKRLQVAGATFVMILQTVRAKVCKAITTDHYQLEVLILRYPRLKSQSVFSFLKNYWKIKY